MIGAYLKGASQEGAVRKIAPPMTPPRKTPPKLGSIGSPLTWRNGLSSRFCRPRESASCPWWWFRFRFRWFSGLIFEEIPKRAKERFRKRRTESDLRAPGGRSHRYLEKAIPIGREALQKPHVNVPQLGPFYWPFAGSKRSIGPLQRGREETRLDTAWHGMTWNDMVWHGMTWHDMVWHGMTWYDMAWHSMTRQEKPGRRNLQVWILGSAVFGVRLLKIWNK